MMQGVVMLWTAFPSFERFRGHRISFQRSNDHPQHLGEFFLCF